MWESVSVLISFASMVPLMISMGLFFSNQSGNRPLIELIECESYN